MTVCANIKRLVFKGFNTIWSLLTEESRPPEESENSHFCLFKLNYKYICIGLIMFINFGIFYIQF